MDSSETKLKNFLSSKEELSQIFRNKNILLFLDYDGTLTPIVERPELALISEDMRQKVQSLAKKIKVSIVSGRATDDVRSKAKIDGIFYAGSHGFEIVSPDGKVEVNKKAEQLRKTVDEIHHKLSEKLKPINGALVEHVKYTISAHYRLVQEKDLENFRKIVEDVVGEYKDFRMTSGKKVFELRPDIDWDKGKAVEWILKVLQFSPENDVAIYIGDDTTDEDAFAVLKNKGIGVLVADKPRKTYAKYIVKDTDEVKKALEMIAAL